MNLMLLLGKIIARIVLCPIYLSFALYYLAFFLLWLAFDGKLKNGSWIETFKDL